MRLTSSDSLLTTAAGVPAGRNTPNQVDTSNGFSSGMVSQIGTRSRSTVWRDSQFGDLEALMKRDGISWLSSTHKSIEEIATTILRDIRPDRLMY